MSYQVHKCSSDRRILLIFAAEKCVSRNNFVGQFLPLKYEYKIRLLARKKDVWNIVD